MPSRRYTPKRVVADYHRRQPQISLCSPHDDHPPIPIQCLPYNVQRYTCLLLHALDALGHILGVEKCSYAAMYPGAQGTEGEWGI